MAMSVVKRFKELLRERRTPITYEIYSPRGCNVDQYVRAISDFKDELSAVNVPDNPLATLRVSSIAYASLVMNSLKVDVIPHITCRDRNLLALQSEILGAHLLGIRNLLIVSGDRPIGRTRELKYVWEANPIRLCEIVKKMNQGQIFCGEFVEMESKTDFFVGGIVIFSRKNEVNYISRKISVGFDFFQSQITFNADEVINFFEEAETSGARIDRPVLISLSPISSGNFLYKLTRIPYVRMPKSLIERFMRSEDVARESVEACLELADKLKSELAYKYRIGFHIIPMGQDDLGREIVRGLRR